MHRKGFLLSALVAAVLAGTAVVGTTGPAGAVGAAIAAGRIGPGTQLVTAGRSCTANFVFRDSAHRVFVGYAASCATRPGTANQAGCAARSLPLGTRVRLADRGRTLGYGLLRYSSLRAMRVAGITDATTCAANDFALVEVRGAARRAVDASMPFWGGPTDVAALPPAGAKVFGLARPTSAARVIPRAGDLGSVAGATAVVSTLLPSVRSARGSGFLDDSGRAVGILTRSSVSGSNTVVSLAQALDFARAHGMPGLHLVLGAGGFSGSAIL